MQLWQEGCGSCICAGIHSVWCAIFHGRVDGSADAPAKPNSVMSSSMRNHRTSMITARSVSTKLHSTIRYHPHIDTSWSLSNCYHQDGLMHTICRFLLPKLDHAGHTLHVGISIEYAEPAGLAGAPVVQRLEGPRPVLDAPVQQQHLAGTQRIGWREHHIMQKPLAQHAAE